MPLFTKKKHTLKGLTGTFAFCVVAATGIFLTGLPAEIQGAIYPYWRTPAPQAAFTRVHWVKMPQSPFIEVGRNPDGSMDINRLVFAHRQAGITPAQEQTLILQLRPLAPILMGVEDPAFERELITQAQLADQQLKTSYPQAYRKLEAMLPGLPPEPPADWTQDKGWVSSFLTWRLLPRYADPTSHIFPEPGDPTLPEATASLEASVAQTGLRALHVPLETWVAPSLIKSLATNLVLANDELRTQTGWPGAVLGLGGRVELTVADPLIANANGTTLSNMRHRVEVVCVFPSIMHEWLHALDYTLPSKVLTSPVGAMTLTGQSGPLRRVELPDAYRAWQALNTQIEQGAPNWIEERKRRAIEKRSVYWIMTQEAVAFAFQAQAGVHWMANPTYNLVDSQAESAGIGMSASETHQLSPTWRATFAALAPLGLSRPLPLQAKTVASN